MTRQTSRDRSSEWIASTPSASGSPSRNVTWSSLGRSAAASGNGFASITSASSSGVRMTTGTVIDANPFPEAAAERLANGVGRAPGRPDDDVAALDVAANVGEAVRLERLAQLGHRDHVAATDVDGPEQRDPGRHVRPA